jgi:autophagy-related protein 5
LIQYPRLSYLAFLLPRLHAFFLSSLIEPGLSSHEAWLSFQGVPLKWHYPLGLLYDLFAGAEPAGFDEQDDLGRPAAATESTAERASAIPWRLTIHYTEFPFDQLISLDAEGKTMQDTFVNSVKEADFVRNGTARTVMSLSKDDSDDLWRAVRERMLNLIIVISNAQLTMLLDDLTLYNKINSKLLNPPGMQLRHVPLKVYLPTSARQPATETIEEEPRPGHLRVVQALVPLLSAPKQPQTLGTALKTILPTIFPSQRNPIFARPVLHGAVVPMVARLDDLGKVAAYTDGFLHITVVMHG